MKYRERYTIVEATRWFKNGDHPSDNVWRKFEDTGETPTEPREGKVVRYFRHPQISDDLICSYCGHRMHDHGWIDEFEGGDRVCPGDWVVTDSKGFHFMMRDDTFRKTYEEHCP
jgi:hypothetical protein